MSDSDACSRLISCCLCVQSWQAPSQIEPTTATVSFGLQFPGTQSPESYTPKPPVPSPGPLPCTLACRQWTLARTSAGKKPCLQLSCTLGPGAACSALNALAWEGSLLRRRPVLYCCISSLTVQALAGCGDLPGQVPARGHFCSSGGCWGQERPAQPQVPRLDRLLEAQRRPARPGCRLWCGQSDYRRTLVPTSGALPA